MTEFDFKPGRVIPYDPAFVLHKVTRSLVDFPSRPGMSGSPVFDQTEAVFGVHHSTSVLDGISYHGRLGPLKQLLSEVQAI